MEGSITAAFALGGVLFGGLFTYLGMRQQLKQQEKLNNRGWRRDVRGKPLLKLREELAVMATKAEKLAKSGNALTANTSTREENEETLKSAIDDWDKYILNGDLQKVLYIQSDAELVDMVKEILLGYLKTYDSLVTYRKELTPSQWGEAARAAEEEIAPKVSQAQELINQKVEKL